MSILQDYSSHERMLGELKLRAIDYYTLHIRTDLRYDQIVYSRTEFEKFEQWYYSDYLSNRCYNHSMEEVSKAVVNFTRERDWDQFHSPENLAKSIAIESGELLECFQWNSDFDKDEVCKELADVVNYSILLADKLDVKLEDIVMKKLEENRKKYPVDKSKGKSTKYNKL